ncbi:MAG: LLM class flavin-dependent oxidoreductase [Myxococcota bacterium]|jgi:alkanesulfonate monooxygenase SsuD/methylene tetrahydromethanopterin reductase-like flavin-dependent oxidoreductase (luciferase family)|nr:LLM class flavin-dependent oxidoreductase [Myxococcota bacterium]
MSDLPLPALAIAAVPGRRSAILELAKEIERREYAGIYCASVGDGLGLCLALALETERIPFGTAIANLYTRVPTDYAASTALIHELSGGRFRFGIGVSHAPLLDRLGVTGGKPLSEMRRFVEAWRETPRTGEQPPLVVAGLRQRMVALAGEIGEGVVFANAARSHMLTSLSALPTNRSEADDFFVGNMIPTCISDDEKAAAAVNRRTLSFYVSLPNYRNYWKEAGYVEEMEAIEKALAAGERERIPSLLSDAWLSDCTLYGSADKVREGLMAWYEAGVSTPIVVPSSAEGNQLKAFEEIFALFDNA